MLLKRTYRLLIFAFLLSLTPLLGIGCSSIPPKEACRNAEKIYLGPLPIQETEAYKIFLNSSKSETAKLSYLGDRIKSAKDLVYYFDGDRYNWLEAYSAGVWLLWQDHKIGEDAHSFIRREAIRFQNPTKPTAIQFPDRSRYLAAEVLLNELDLLEDTINQNSSTKPGCCSS